MKKTLTHIVMLLLVIAAQAQTDTIFGYSPRYYLQQWYDTTPQSPYRPISSSNCGWRLECRPVKNLSLFGGHPYYDNWIAELARFFATEPVAVKGVAIYTPRKEDLLTVWNGHGELGRQSWITGARDTTWFPEFFKIWRINDTMQLTCLDTTECWNQKEPKLVQLKQSCPGRGPVLDTIGYGSAYEAFFKEPVLITDSVFFVGTTANSNSFIDLNHNRGYPTLILDAFFHDPNSEEDFGNMGFDQGQWDYQHAQFVPYWRKGAVFFIFPIVDYANLSAEPADSLMGSVSGSGRYSEYTYRTITATPAPGHTFVQWSDGSTDNPRSVYLTSDTLLTALFARAPCQVEVRPNHTYMGSTSGSGSYWAGDTIAISATPNTYYGFLKWDDGDTANPRQVVLTQDTAFTAIFASREGIDAPQGPNPVLLPNPTAGKVQILGLDEPALSVEILDMTGRPAASFRHTNSLDLSDLPQGSYLVQILTAHGLHTLKLVKE